MLRFLSIVCDLERTNQLNLLPDKDLVDLCHPIEPYQVTKNHCNKYLVCINFFIFLIGQEIYEKFFAQAAIQIILQKYQILLLIVDTNQEESSNG
ncbi:element excision factor XisH family protein [Microcystis aeruginosa]|uniref:element excision factor XisH family protein n=1 Tax=Microcystis aeruginosa TaxID=1126 RepID=UPI003D18CA9C